MACIVWRMPNGEEFKVPAEKAHKPPLGAFNTGIVDWACEGGSTQQREVDAMMERNGIQWGSAIAWVTKRIGVRQCSSCKAREEILNSAKELGWAETIRQLKETV